MPRQGEPTLHAEYARFLRRCFLPWALLAAGERAWPWLRIELIDGPVWTLFITGPVVREWGFLCPRGFVHWRRFTAPHDKGAIGRGCEA